MIKKAPALVITFHTATEAFAAEKYCAAHQIPARLIPLPGEISAGCGLALKTPKENADTLPAQFKKDGIVFASAHVLSV